MNTGCCFRINYPSVYLVKNSLITSCTCQYSFFNEPNIDASAKVKFRTDFFFETTPRVGTKQQSWRLFGMQNGLWIQNFKDFEMFLTMSCRRRHYVSRVISRWNCTRPQYIHNTIGKPDISNWRSLFALKSQSAMLESDLRPKMRSFLFAYVQLHMFQPVLWAWACKACRIQPLSFTTIFASLPISLWHLFWRSPILTPFLFISRNAMCTLRWHHCMLLCL